MGKLLIWMFFVACMTFGMYSAAQDAEKGMPEQQFRGRRAGIAMLFSSLGRSLGTTGSLVLGGAVELALIGVLVKVVRDGD